MNAHLRILAVGLLLFVSCARESSNSDTARIERFVHRWSPNIYLGGPFSGLKEWIAESDSGWDIGLRRIGQYEVEEHATIDSMSDAPSTKPVKDILHLLIRSEYHLEKLDIALSRIATRLSPSFLKHPTLRGDSLLTSARALLHETDLTSVEITALVRSFNTHARSMGLRDTLRLEYFQVSRKQIVHDYYYFLEPELEAYLLAPN